MEALTKEEAKKTRYVRHQEVGTDEFLAQWDGYIRSQAGKLQSGFAKFGMDIDDIQQLGRMALLWIPPENRWSTNYVLLTLRRKMFLPWYLSKRAKREHTDISLSEPLHQHDTDAPTMFEDTLVDGRAQSELNCAAAGLDLDKMFAVLTPKQREIMDLVRDGHLFKEIAGKLGASRTHVYNVYNASMAKIRKRFRVRSKGNGFRDPNYYSDSASSHKRKFVSRAEADKLEARALKLHAEGISNSAIGKLMGMPTSSVWGYLHRAKRRRDYKKVVKHA